MYKKASKLKLRFQTNRGVLSVEQLWDLSFSDLSNTIKAQLKTVKKDNDDELSFLGTTNVADSENQLRFDILKDVYLTRKEEVEAARNEAAAKENNQKIMAIIAEKQDGALKDMSIDELKALLK